MRDFVELPLIGTVDVTVAIAPQHVVQATQFDSGRGGIGTTLKLVNGDSVNVRGTLQEVIAKLTAT